MFLLLSELKLIQQKSTVKVSYTIIYVTLEVSSFWNRKPHLIQEASLGRLNICNSVVTKVYFIMYYH